MKRILGFEVWFDDNKHGIQIVEESLYQPNFGRVFTMLRMANDSDYMDAYFDI